MSSYVTKVGIEEELKEWKETVSHFAHDLASPLSFLDQYIKAVAAPKEEFIDDAVDLQAAALRSYEKVRRLIDCLRGYVRASEPTIGCADFARIVRNSVDEIAPKARARGAIIRYEGPERLMGVCDERNMERVIANLLTNALEAMEDEGGTIIASLGYDRNVIVLEITDDGKGIPQELIENIFERGATYGKKHGTGLGLAFCKKTVEAHKGTIAVRSVVGKGTTFSIMLPDVAEFPANEFPHHDAEIRRTNTNDNADVKEHDLARGDYEFLPCRCAHLDATLDPI